MKKTRIPVPRTCAQERRGDGKRLHLLKNGRLHGQPCASALEILEPEVFAAAGFPIVDGGTGDVPGPGAERVGVGGGVAEAGAFGATNFFFSYPRAVICCRLCAIVASIAGFTQLSERCAASDRENFQYLSG